MNDLLTVPDDDDTRRGLIHAFAFAEGIHREDVPRVSAEARRRWENRADRALTELRLLSAAYAAGQGVVLTRQITGPTTREEVDKLSKSHIRELADLDADAQG